MRLYPLLACVLAAFVLSSCSSPPPKKAKKTDASSSESKTTPAATETKTESSEAKAEAPKKEEPKASEPVKAPEPAKEIKPVAKEAAAKFGPASGHEGEQVGGKTIQTWVNELMTDDKTKIIDALAALQMAGKWSSMAIPRVEQLTKHSDKEIADSAAETLKAIK